MQVFFFVLNITEEEADGFVVARNAELKEVGALLYQFYLSEVFGQCGGALESPCHRIQVSHKVGEAHAFLSLGLLRALKN